MILTLFQGFVFLSYVIFLLIKFKGPLPSISDSRYRLAELGGVWYSLFTWFCWLIGIAMLFQPATLPLFIFSGFGLCFVGAATMFKNKHDPTPWVHFIGAAFCIIFALLGIGFVLHSWLPLIGFGLSASLLSMLRLKNTTWWIEIAAFIFIILGLLF